MKRPKFINEYIYHAYNRGVEKRNIYLDDFDKLRFIHDLFEFNDTNPAPDFRIIQRHVQQMEQKTEVRLPSIEIEKKQRKLLVEILAFCLMPNHFHLLLRQKKESGITEFMRKIGTGYTNYFNQKYARSGVLFQGKFKAVLIEKEAHLAYIPHYIHTNPLDLVNSEWRQNGFSDLNEAVNFLEEYRWSSLSDYLNKKNFPSITQRNFLLNFFGGTKQYGKDLRNIIKSADFKEIIKDVIFD